MSESTATRLKGKVVAAGRNKRTTVSKKKSYLERKDDAEISNLPQPHFTEPRGIPRNFECLAVMMKPARSSKSYNSLAHSVCLVVASGSGDETTVHARGIA